MRVERSFRGITVRLARHYLTNLGGEAVADDRVEGEWWSADLASDTVEIGPTMTLTEVNLVFRSDREDGSLEDLIERFAQKAMRAGG